MSWTINVTTDAKEFLDGLTADEKVEVFATIKLLREVGPALRRPTSGTLRDSELSNLKELRIRFERKQFRIIYAFDSEQNAILLVGGDKVPLGEKLWYPKYIARAKKLYEAHEAEIELRRRQATHSPRGKVAKRGKKQGK
ncbi:TPA: type II toxin-antitoxin system RelE/ParE family toxin [Stenotrophomonas maltophilia]